MGDTTAGVVLVVEPNAHERLLYEWELGDAGYHVVSAASIAEALGGARANCLHLAVVDPGRCGEDEMEALGILMALEPKLPVVIYTGYDAGVLKLRLKDGRPIRSAVSCISKTSDLTRLTGEIRRVLADGMGNSRGVTCCAP